MVMMMMRVRKEMLSSLVSSQFIFLSRKVLSISVIRSVHKCTYTNTALVDFLVDCIFPQLFWCVCLVLFYR